MRNTKRKESNGPWGGARQGGGRPLKGTSKRIKVALTLPGHEIAIFDNLAKHRGISRSDAIAEAMTEYVMHHDAVIQMLNEAPMDDETLTPEHAAKLDAALAEIERGEFISAEDAKRELLG